MKKLKFIAMLLAALFVSTSFVACSDDDEDNPDFVGTWSRGEDHGYEELVTFYANGTGKEWVTYNGEIEERYTSAFTWKAEGNKITMTYEEDGETETEEIYWKIDGGNLVIAEDAEFEYSHTLKPNKPATGGGNSDDANSNLLGTWIGEEMGFTLEAGGKGRSWSIWEGVYSEYQDVTWSVSGNKMTVNYKGWNETATGYWKIEGGKLYMSESSSFSGEVMVYAKQTDPTTGDNNDNGGNDDENVGGDNTGSGDNIGGGDANEPIIGTWQCKGVDGEFRYTQTLTFMIGGKGKFVETEYGTNEFKWTLSEDGVLTVDFTTGELVDDDFSTTAKIEGDKLILGYVKYMDEVFTRK